MDARRDLEAPDFPEPLDYLYRWLMDLHGRSGAGMSGMLPLSWVTLDAWSRMTGTVVHAHEAQALMDLDLCLCFPGEKKAAKVERPPERAWPAKKVSDG